MKRYDIDYAGIGKRIKALRRSKDYTQEKLAEISGVEVHSLSRIERGRSISLESFIRLCIGLEGSANHLLFGDMFVQGSHREDILPLLRALDDIRSILLNNNAD